MKNTFDNQKLFSVFKNKNKIFSDKKFLVVFNCFLKVILKNNYTSIYNN